MSNAAHKSLFKKWSIHYALQILHVCRFHEMQEKTGEMTGKKFWLSKYSVSSVWRWYFKLSWQQQQNKPKPKHL